MSSAEFYNSRPKKATGAGVLFINDKDELLIVKPNYLDRWLWPGGGIEENETPLQAAIRESQEEIGVTPQGLRLAFVQYRPPKADGQHEAVHFVFAVEVTDDKFLEKLKLGSDEIEDAKFVPVGELSQYLSAQRVGAVNAYMQNRGRGGFYIENGALAA